MIINKIWCLVILVCYFSLINEIIIYLDLFVIINWYLIDIIFRYLVLFRKLWIWGGFDIRILYFDYRYFDIWFSLGGYECVDWFDFKIL